MADGTSKPIEKLIIGDMVLAWDGENSFPTKVVAIPFDDFIEAYRIELKYTDIIADLNHCFKVDIKKRGEYSVRELIKIGYPQKKLISSGKQNYMEEVLPFSGLLLGLYLGDGSSSKSKSNGYHNCHFSNTEDFLKNIFKEEITKYFPELRCVTYPSSEGEIYIKGKYKNGNSFLNSLKKLGLAGKKSNEKFVPDIFKRGSIKDRQGLLRGMILTDGCVDKYKTVIYSNSIRMLEDLKDILISLGGRGVTYKRNEAVGNHKAQFLLQFSNEFLSVVGIDGLGRKSPKVKLKYNPRRDDLIIRNIDYVGVLRGRCITVEDKGHTFILDNGIVTCNSGKTVSGVVEAAMHSTGCYPLWYPKENRISKANKGRIFGQDFLKSIGGVITPAIEDWFPKGSIVDKEKNNQGVYVQYYVKHETGKLSSFDCLTYEQPSKLCEGWAGDWVWYDEPPPRGHRVATKRGLVARQGKEWFTLTPLDEPYLFDELFENIKVYSVVCDMRHNLYRWNPLIRDYIGLTPEAILEFESILSDNELQARARGKFMFLAGRIFKIWDRKIHTFDRKEMWKLGESGAEEEGQPPRRWPRIMLIDPHPRRKCAILWVAQDPEWKRLFAYREGWVDGDHKEICKFIRDQELATGDKVKTRVLDPNYGKSPEGSTKKIIRDLLQEASDEVNYPMKFMFGDDHKELARKKIESELLYYDKSMPISIINRPNFQVANDLVNCIYQMEHYIWDDYKNVVRDEKEQPKDINTHMPDLVHYLVLYNWDMKEEIVEGVGSYYGT